MIWQFIVVLGVAAPPDVTLKESLDLATAAVDICQAKGFAASVSVVDTQGVVKVTLRADGATKAPVAAPRKAATAVVFKAPGSEMEPREKSDPAFAALIASKPDLYNAHAGSIPLYRGEVLAGGVAIGDVPHATADQCVREAVQKFPLK